MRYVADDSPTLVPIRRRWRDPHYMDGQQRAAAAARQNRDYARLRAKVRAATEGKALLSPAEVKDALRHHLLSMTTPDVLSGEVGSLGHYDRVTGAITRRDEPFPERPTLQLREIEGCLEIGIGRSFDRWVNSVDFYCSPRTPAQRALFLEAALEAALSGDRTLYDPAWGLRREIVMGRKGVPLILVDGERRCRPSLRPRPQPEERTVRLVPDGWRWERAYLARPPGWLRGEVTLERMEALLPETMAICLRHALVKAGIPSADVRGASLTRKGVDLRVAPPRTPWGPGSEGLAPGRLAFRPRA